MWVISVLFGFLLLVLQAFALRDMWVWFISPLGIHGLTLLQAMGIMNAKSLFSMLNFTNAEAVKKEISKATGWPMSEVESVHVVIAQTWVYMLITAAVYLSGYIIHLFQ